MNIHPFLLTLYVIFLVWVVVFMKNSKCVEKYMDYFSIVKAVSIQDHILFSSYHSNSWWTKVITFVGSLYNLDVVLFTCPWPETNIPPIYLHWDSRNLEKNTVWTGKNNQFVVKLGKKISSSNWIFQTGECQNFLNSQCS